MSTTITLVIVVALSFVAGEFIQRIATRRGLLLSGAEYLIVGVLLGPLVSGIVTADSLILIEPAMWLLIALVGFTMGLPLRHAISAGGPVRLIAATLFFAASVGTIGAAGFAVLKLVYPEVSIADMALPAVVFGVCGTVVSARFIDLAAHRFDARGPLTSFLTASAEWGSALGVLVAGVVMDYTMAGEAVVVGDVALPGELWTGSSLLIGVFAGVLFWLFHRDEDSDERTFLATVGVVVFASGMAKAVGASPLLVGLLAGVTVSLLSRQADQLSETLGTLDRPAGIVLMLFAGTLWTLPSVYGWLGVSVYLGARLVTLWLYPRIFVRPVLKSAPAGWIGSGMRGQGVLPVAIALALVLVHPEFREVGSIILVGVFVLEFGAGTALRRLLGDAGELNRVEEDPDADALPAEVLP